MELLNYKRFGQGQPLIILHGFLGSLDNWLTLGKRFAADYEVILVDQRNHGKSFHSHEFGYDEMVGDLESLIDSLELENPILLGHSMGGKTVMQYAAFHPQKILKLIVADIGPKAYPVHHDRILEGLKAIPVEKIESRQEADDVLSKYVEFESTRVFLLKNLKRTTEGFDWKMNLPVLCDKISEIGKELSYHLPIETGTLFIRGGSSDYIPDGDWEDIEEIFPNAGLATIDGAGHWLHAESPDKFYELVINFLA
ncbi:Pimeloyl-ACP methyl ester carboxylesterase [Reichenbachiella faecimaris]|uniref:Pimeloyl-ACP methyl ester carboxylesterase n=1 Tax=Reichenbachiella faecimaris TaxID=692418 RepID=A0A1W2GFC5_REIFA|nr:alpha/beta fold hydrolase [Reichenbachiella faecimaris]SMD35355.1 Pimeloyl-ACP methyl ester carboxylesterase [Reichenbachiella faecimaris]